MRVRPASVGSGLASAILFLTQAQELTPRWDVDLGVPARGAPAVLADGGVVVGAFDGRVLCFGADGTLRWAHSLAGQPALSCAIADDDSVIVGDSTGRVYALTAEGAERWVTSLDQPINRAAAIAADGTICVATDQGVATLTAGGELQWRLAFGNQLAAPTLGADGTAYLADGWVYEVTPPGKSGWWKALAAVSATGVAIGPAGVLYAGTGHNALLGAFNMDGTTRWTQPMPADITGQVVISEDGLIGCTGADGLLRVLGPDGQERWSLAVAPSSDGLGQTPAFTEDGLIVCAFPFGRLELQHLDHRGTVRQSLALAGPNASSPVLTDAGRIYLITADRRLNALQTSARPVRSGWPMAYGDARHRSRELRPPGPPGPVPNVAAAQGASATNVTLAWSSAAHARSYEVWRARTNDPAAAVLIATNLVGRTDWSDAAFPANATYHYWVRARNALGAGPFGEGAIGYRRRPADGEEVWTFTSDRMFGTSSPALAKDGTLFVVAAPVVSFDPQSPAKLQAIDRYASLRWDRSLEGSVDVTPMLGPDDSVYVAGRRAFFAFSAEGELKWRFETNAEFVADAALGADGSIYTATSDGTICALDARGQLKWSSAVAGGMSGAPVLGPDGSLYLVDTAGSLHALDAQGQLRWSSTLARPLSPPFLDASGVVYTGSTDRRLYAFNSDGSPRWAAANTGAIKTALTQGPDGVFYFGTDDYRIVAANPDGGLRWAFATGFVVYSTPALGRDGTVYCGGADRRFYALFPDGSLKHVWNAGSPVYSSPVIGPDGLVYFTSYENKVHAVQGSSPPAAGPWPMLGRGPDHASRSEPVPPPAAPRGLTASRDAPNQVNLDWNAAELPASYEVWRASEGDPQAGVRLAANLTSPHYEDSTAFAGHRYLYRVRARNARGFSEFSEPSAGSCPPVPEGSVIGVFPPMGEIRSSAALGADGAIYISSIDGNLYAYGRDGVERWRHAAQPMAATPVVRPDGTVYGATWAGGAAGAVFALNPSGAFEWAAEWPGPFSTSPALAEDGATYLMDDYGNLHATGAGGATEWTVALGGSTVTSAAIGQDGTVFAVTGGRLNAVDPAGALTWSLALPNLSWSSPAIGAEGEIYVGCSDGRLHAYETDGRQRWAGDLGATVGYGSPVLGPDGRVYVGTLEGLLVCVNAQGVKEWAFAAEGNIIGAALVAADGTVYFGSADHRVYALRPDGTLKWSVTTGGVVQGSPLLEAETGVLYIGSGDGRLYAIQAASKTAESPWPMFRRSPQRDGRAPGSAPVPAPPEALQASQGGSRYAVRLTWSPVPGATSYEVFRGERDDFTAAVRLAGNLAGSTQFDDETAPFEQPRHYWVRARNGHGVSRPSASAAGFQSVVKWWRDLGGDAGGSCALAADGTIYVPTLPAKVPGSDAYASLLHAFGPDGARRWEFDGGYVYGSPMLAVDGTIYVTARTNLLMVDPGGRRIGSFAASRSLASGLALRSDGVIHGLDSAGWPYAVNPDGSLLWSWPGSSGPAPPAFGRADTLYLGWNGVSKVMALEPSGASPWTVSVAPAGSFAVASDGQICFPCLPTGLCALGPNGDVRWTFPADAPASSPVIGPEDAVYFTTTLGTVWALDHAGALRWQTKPGTGWGIPTVLADGRLLVGGTNEAGYVLRTLDRDGTVWRDVGVGGNVSDTSPVIGADHTIYVAAGDRRLYAIRGDAGLAASAWPTLQHDFARRNRATFMPLETPPPKVGFLAATAGTHVGRIWVSWGPAVGARHYRLWRATVPDPARAVVAARDLAAPLQFEDTDVERGRTYYYWVQSENAAGPGPLSEMVSGASAREYQLWSFPTEGAVTLPPAIANDGAVYVLSESNLYALTPGGALKWQFHPEADPRYRPRLPTPPLLTDDGHIYLVVARRVYRLDESGNVAWTKQAATSAFAPALGPGGRLCVPGWDNSGFTVLHPDGSEAWRSGVGLPAAAPSVGADGAIYFPSTRLYAFEADGRPRWVAAASVLPRGPVSLEPHGFAYYTSGAIARLGLNGVEQTRFPINQALAGEICLGADGSMYFVSSAGNSNQRLTSMSPAGDIMWSATLTAPAGTPAVGQEVIYVTDRSVLLALDPDGYLRWKYTGPVAAAAGIPGLAPDGTVYFGCGATLQAVRAFRPPATSSWPQFRRDARRSGSLLVTQLRSPSITEATAESDGGFRFMIHGEAGRSYAVESSSDLAAWNVVERVRTPAEGLLYRPPPAPLASPRFFRVVGE